VYDKTALRTLITMAGANAFGGVESFPRMISELGLRLERFKGRVEILVIEHAAQPSVN
jgi:uncharacterized protein (TIGR03435 family)